MKYWEEFQDKWGFSDGDATPPDACACRAVYVREINKLARKYKSKIRLLAWDRQGCHNGLLIMRIPLSLVKNVPVAKLYTGAWRPKDISWKDPTDDKGMERAISKAFDMDLDQYVTTKVSYV